MLPEIGNRLVSLVRCPDGRDGQGCFQRHAGAGLPAVFRRVAVAESGGKREAYLLLSGVEGLVSAAQVGVLEIHVWGATADDIERPNRLVFDLDPGDGVDFAEVNPAAAGIPGTPEALGPATRPIPP